MSAEPFKPGGVIPTGPTIVFLPAGTTIVPASLR
jgi:hypothetical protein